jgi:hypothetical protein
MMAIIKYIYIRLVAESSSEENLVNKFTAL